ncbi:MAG: O-antigen ligase family protein [Actinomycetota bacterium]|nr:O-antigen ligase family protein [Actinomycetota bacterium]
MRALRDLVDRDATGALLLASAIPFLFFHEKYQLELTVDLGSTSADIRLSDLAVLVVLLAAGIYAARKGRSRLGPGRILWIPGTALLVWLAFQALRPASVDDARFEDHLVSYVKLAEYALLAVAVPLLVRRTQDLTIVLGSLVLWSTIASTVALAQFFGLDVFDAWNAGWRQPSFLGHHDLAALSAVSAALAATGILCLRTRLPAPALWATALVAGAVGLMLAGSVAAAGGFALGALVLGLAARGRFEPSPRRFLAVFALVLVVAGGVTAIRADSLEQFVRFLGVRGDERPQGVETYSQRTVLAYIGLRVWEDNPVVGVGWQRSAREDVFEPYLEDARKRFPDVVDFAFPAAGREWGVQNLYIQMLADAGIVGLLLLLSVGVSGVVLALRTVTYAPNAWATGVGLAVMCALLTLAGEWASLGIVAGIPLQAATCLLLGLAAAGGATVEEEAGV